MGLLFFSGALFAYALFYYVRERLAASWPTVAANVVELEPQSLFERDMGNKFRLNLDTDFFVVWSVDGREYRRRIDEDSSAAVGGVKVWRKKPALGALEIRYDPSDPKTCFVPKDKGTWKMPAALSVLIAIGYGIYFLVSGPSSV